MKEISVIGATSPLGIDLVRILADVGYRVFASFRSETRVPEIWHQHASISCHHLDLNHPNEFGSFLKNTVIWLAHLDQGRFNDRELEINLAVFDEFLSRGTSSAIERVIFVSSGGSVYGETEKLPIGEEHSLEPLSSYGKAKAALEQRLNAFAESSGISTAVIRPGNIYGFTDPNDDHKGIVAAFLHSIKTRKPFQLIHKGQTVRDFVHVDDVSRAVIAAVENDRKDIIWNVATAKGHSIAEVIAVIQTQTGLDLPDFLHIENYSSDVSTNILSIDRICSESTWQPNFDLETGIAATIKTRSGK